jgi:hypothetical protein
MYMLVAIKMLILKSLDVSTYDGQSYNISWEFEPDSDIVANYTVNIYRSESPTVGIDEYDIVVSGISANLYSYVDTSVSQLLDFGRPWFYKLAVTDELTAEVSYQPEPAAYLKNEVVNRVFREIVRRKNINLLNPRFSGRDFKIFKRRSWGTHCSVCWDASLQRSTDSSCTTCFGTGWINGYYNPVSIRGMKNSSPKLNQINMFGEWKPSDSVLYMLGYPPLKSRDIIADDNNHLWTVVQIRTTEHLGYIIEQQAQIASIAQDDFLYRYLLTTGLILVGTQIVMSPEAPAVYATTKLFLADTTGGDALYTLPVATAWKGRNITFKADNLSGGVVIITPTSPSTIDTYSSFIINNPFGVVTLNSDGLNWWAL